MKVLQKILLPLVMILIFGLTACLGEASSSPAKADLYIVVGNNASRFTGKGNGDGLLLDQFRKEHNVDVFVLVANDREINDFRNQMLAGQEGSPDILIVDDSLQADKLQKVKYIATHNVGAAIRSDIADQIGLKGNVMSYTDFVPLLKSGQVSVVASNALAGADSAEFFFSVSAWCSNSDASNLTAGILQLDYVRTCGKEVYDYIKSTNGSNAAIDLVYNTAVSGDSNGYNAVITFDSALLGDNGLNFRLIKENKPVFKFFYFKEATAKVSVAIGTKDLSNDQSKSDTANLLITYLLSKNSQSTINLAGFTEGSSALVRHDDTAFISEWGVASNPTGVQIVNPPISKVAENALLIYRDFYKRMKVVYFIYDTSGSTQTRDILSYDENGNPETITRQQAIARAIDKFTKEGFQATNGIVPGPKDKFKHLYFASGVSEIVSESEGPNTSAAGQIAIAPIGPAYGPFDYYKNEAEIGSKIKYSDGITPYEFGGTAMFDAADYALNDILNNYDPNADYYIVILTDGKKEGGMEGVVYDVFGNLKPGSDSFYKNWLEAGKQNISLVGVQFGTNGDSLNADKVTKLMNGDTYPGTDDKGLIEAFKFILGN